MSAMSAIEQPALRSGRIDPLVVAGEDVGRLGHEVHAAEDDVGGGALSAANRASLKRVAAGVGPLDDLVALVVVAEDQQPVAELRLRGARSSR